MNKWCGSGNIVKKPELETTQSGHLTCKFSIACPRRYKNASGESETDFIPVVAWRSLAESCAKYCDKGMRVNVMGSIQTRNYTTKDGIKRYVTEIIADDIEFIGAKNKTGTESKETVEKTNKFLEDLKPIDDDLPF